MDKRGTICQIKFFFDSNILVYLQDSNDEQKQQIARQLVSEQTKKQWAVISTQVLQEFYNVTTTKLQQDKSIIKKCIRNFYTNIETVQISPQIIEHAIDISVKIQCSFWDSLIIAAAVYAQCNILYTEDLNDGQIIYGVKIVNPFKMN